MIRPFLVRFVHEDQGQDLIEYALLAGLIALAASAAITFVGSSVNDKMNLVGSTVASAS